MSNSRSEKSRGQLSSETRSAGISGTEQFEEIVYEGYGPGGAAIIVETATDNPVRTVANVRSYFNKLGGNMGATGSVAFNFDRMGEITYAGKIAGEDAMMEAAIEAGAADVESDLGDEGSGHTVYTAFEDLNEVATALEAVFGEASSTKIIWRPKSTVTVEGENVATLMRLLDALEDDDDVQNVYSNEEISDADMAKLG